MLKRHWVANVLSKPIETEKGFSLKVLTVHNEQYFEGVLFFETEQEALNVKYGDEFLT